VELERLARLLDDARAGRGAIVAVEGPAGIGKTELLAAVRRLGAGRGLRLLRARGGELESGMAFGVVRQLLEASVLSMGLAERQRLLAGPARIGASALGVVVGDAPGDEFAALHGLYWLCANLAEREPLLLVVDDLQWVDAPSLAWLAYLGRRVDELEILLVVSVREGDPRAGERPVRAVVNDPTVHRMGLSPLTAESVAILVRSEMGQVASAEFCTACHELTGGNPLYLRELLAAAREKGMPVRTESVAALRSIAPSAVGTSVLARMGRMRADAVALARALAILGPQTEVTVVAELAELEPGVAELAADTLAAAQILAPVRPLEFFHPLIGEAVYADLAPGARRLGHRRAATILSSHHAGVDRVAAHLLVAGPAADRWVVGRLREAAEEALERGAPELAARYLQRALTELPAEGQRPALLLLLGTAEWRARLPDGIMQLEQALTAAGKDRATLIAACQLLVYAYYERDQPERSIDVLGRTLAAVGDDDAALALTLESWIATVGITNEFTASEALRRAEVLHSRLAALADPPFTLLVLLASCAARSNRASEAQELAERALACQPSPLPLFVTNVLIYTLRVMEQYDVAQPLYEDLLVAARRRAATQDIVGILAWRASASRECGALADAEADARWALERAEWIRGIQAGSELIQLLIERDALDQAQQELEQIADPRGSGSQMVARFLLARGRLRVAQSRLNEALDDFLACGARCERLGLPMLSAAPWRGDAALVHAALGNTAEARRLAGEQLELARAFGRPRTLGMALRATGMVEGGEAGLKLLNDAVLMLERSQGQLELARALTDLGAMLRRAGQRVKARIELERGLDLAHHLGAHRIANQARAELIAAGAKPRRDAITGRDALTAGELRVARLAAEGLTNREIAQALFITTKTAKAHLNRTYRKLEITRRDQLATALINNLDESRQHSTPRATPIS